jgi:hypothetical protein
LFSWCDILSGIIGFSGCVRPAIVEKIIKPYACRVVVGDYPIEPIVTGKQKMS